MDPGRRDTGGVSVDHMFEKYPGDAGERSAEGTVPSEPATRHPASSAAAARFRPHRADAPAPTPRADANTRPQLGAVLAKRPAPPRPLPVDAPAPPLPASADDRPQPSAAPTGRAARHPALAPAPRADASAQLRPGAAPARPLRADAAGPSPLRAGADDGAQFDTVSGGHAAGRPVSALISRRDASTAAGGLRAGGDARARLDAVGGAGRGARQAASDVIPVLEPFRGLLPEGLRRGEAVSLASRDRSPDYLALALLAGALAAGLWCAAVGVAGLGGVALAELLGDTDRRAALDRLLLVPEPGEQWAEVTAGLADGVDLLLVRPPGAVSAEVGRRVDARLRQGRASGTRHSAAMLVLGNWAGARMVLRTAQTVWTGLDGVGPSAGTGHLTGGRGTLVAEGRATAGRPRTLRLWLPASDGAARALIDVQAEGATSDVVLDVGSSVVPGVVPGAAASGGVSAGASSAAAVADGSGTGRPPRPPLTAVA